MICPACKAGLQEYKYHDLLVNVCPNCHGIWFDPDEMKPYIEFLLREHNEIPYDKIALHRKRIAVESLAEPVRSCPRCNEPMEKINYAYESNIILDKCPSCEGIWTDADELYRLAMHKKGNPKLDKLGQALTQEGQRIQQMMDFSQLIRWFPGSLWGYLYNLKR